MSSHIYDHVSEFLAGLELDDDTAAQVRRAVSDTFGASAAASPVDPNGRFRVVEFRIVALVDAANYGSDEQIAGMPLSDLAYQVIDGAGMLHTFEVASLTAVGDQTISALADEAGGDPGWFLGQDEAEEEQS